MTYGDCGLSFHAQLFPSLYTEWIHATEYTGFNLLNMRMCILHHSTARDISKDMQLAFWHEAWCTRESWMATWMHPTVNRLMPKFQ